MKKTVKLTQSGIREAARRVLIEMPMGVPNNIVETAEQIYSLAIEKFSNEYGLGWDDKNMKYEVGINGDFAVSDYKFKSIIIELHLSEFTDEYADEPPDFLGAAVGNSMTVSGNQITQKIGDTMHVVFRFAVGYNWNVGMLLDLLKSDRPTTISMLSHELFHQFEDYKKPIRDGRQKARYEAVQKLRIQNVRPINHFLHLLYFIHEIERGTRSSEFYGQLKASNVTKENFKEFFKESNLIKYLAECRDYTFDGLINELKNDMDKVNEFLTILKDQGAEVDLSAPDSVKINDTLKYFHIILNNATLEEYTNVLRAGINHLQSIFLSMSGERNPQEDEAQRHLDNFVKEVKKFKNYQEFFGYWIKKLNFVGETTIKKLSKLYDMVDSDNKSIVNWDLHHKINNTAEKTKNRLHELLRDYDRKITDSSSSD